jgi:mannose-6-phosphate isomerase class I
VRWEPFVESLAAALRGLGLQPRWLSTERCFLPETELRRMLHPFLTDDPVFGRLYHGHLTEMWDGARLAELRREIADAEGPIIVYGPGAARVGPADLTVYVDLPKDVGQALAARGEVFNLGSRTREPFNLTYKRLYFVDWPVLNREKRRLLPALDLFVDATTSEEPALLTASHLRRALSELARAPFRVKPWFAPGPWGGQWMKEHFDLSRDQPNYAWSFELIAPENGLLLGDGATALECSFDLLLWQETVGVLGERVAARYGSYFPLRFDYLDTMGGTNLSCQVHPRVDYIRDEFGEPFTQDESYYIVANRPDARVFLGLRDDADVAAFRQAATSARDEGVAFEIGDYVHSRPSAPGDLFLIPSGTVHCSGKDNLVLEISATPYIFTMKIYDYLRMDLQGKLRHVHLDHAFANVDASRRTGWVDEHLVQRPRLLRRGAGWAEYQIGHLDQLFYDVNRLEFATAIDDVTPDGFAVLNLVEGTACTLEAPDQPPVELRFAETWIVPASVARYTLRNQGESECKVVKAFVK